MTDTAATTCADNRSPGASAEPSVVDLTAGWLESAQGRAKYLTRLAAAEARLAATSLVVIIALAIVVALLVVGSWGMVVAGTTLAATAAGAPLWAMLGGWALVHLVVAGGLIRYVFRLGGNLQFAKTRAHMFTPDAKETGHAE
jgi:hypothetical protein